MTKQTETGLYGSPAPPCTGHRPLAPGLDVAGRYRMIRRLGAGAMGEVWLGKHLSVGGKVAIKRRLPGRSRAEPALIARFQREARLLGRLRSGHIARVIDFFEDEAHGLILVMDYIEGPPLSAHIATRRYSVEAAVGLGIDIACGLLDLHDAHIVHRDIKPANVILQPYRGGRRAVLVDLGLGRVMSEFETDHTNITRADMTLGTLTYMAPEQILNCSGVTGAADVYSLGAVLYRVVAGRHAFERDTELAVAQAKLFQEAPRLELERDDDLARRFADLVAHALRREVSERIGTAAEMLSRLRELAALRKAMGSSAASRMSGAVPVAYPPLMRAPAVTWVAFGSQPAAEPAAPLRPLQDGPRSGVSSGMETLWARLGLVAVLALIIVAGGLGVAIAYQLKIRIQGRMPPHQATLGVTHGASRALPVQLAPLPSTTADARDVCEGARQTALGPAPE